MDAFDSDDGVGVEAEHGGVSILISCEKGYHERSWGSSFDFENSPLFAVEGGDIQEVLLDTAKYLEKAKAGFGAFAARP